MGRETRASPASKYEAGGDDSKILLDDLECTGSEYSLWDCPYSEADCLHVEDIAIVCKPPTTVLRGTTIYPVEGGGIGVSVQVNETANVWCAALDSQLDDSSLTRSQVREFGVLLQDIQASKEEKSVIFNAVSLESGSFKKRPVKRGVLYNVFCYAENVAIPALRLRMTDLQVSGSKMSITIPRLAGYLLTDPLIVDIDESGEVTNFRVDIIDAGVELTDVPKLNPGTLTEILGTRTHQLLIIPELEIGPKTTVMSESDHIAVKDFVKKGGHVIMAGHASRDGLKKLNKVFGWSLSLVPSSCGAYAFQRTTDLSPNSHLALSDWSRLPYVAAIECVPEESLPDSATSYYSDKEGNSWIWKAREGAGSVLYLAFDWAESFSFDRLGWRQVLRHLIEDLPITAFGPLSIIDATSGDTSVTAHIQLSTNTFSYEVGVLGSSSQIPSMVYCGAVAESENAVAGLVPSIKDILNVGEGTSVPPNDRTSASVNLRLDKQLVFGECKQIANDLTSQKCWRAIKLAPDLRYNLYCFVDGMTQMMVEANTILVSADSTPPKLQLLLASAQAASVEIGVQVNEPSRVWCIAREPSSSFVTSRQIKEEGAETLLKLDAAMTNAPMFMSIKSGIRPGRQYAVYCTAEDMAYPRGNTIEDDLSNIPLLTKSKVDSPVPYVSGYTSIPGGAVIRVSMDRPGHVYCSPIFESSKQTLFNTASIPRSNEIKEANMMVTISAPWEVELMKFESLQPATAYSLYCVADTTGTEGEADNLESNFTPEYRISETVATIITGGKYCDKNMYPKIIDKGEETPFDLISEEENNKVRAFLSNTARLTPDEITVLEMELLPDKEEVLKYISKGGKLPSRWARTRIHRCNETTESGMFEEYKIGPLESNELNYSTILKKETNCTKFTAVRLLSEVAQEFSPLFLHHFDAELVHHASLCKGRCLLANPASVVNPSSDARNAKKYPGGYDGNSTLWVPLHLHDADSNTIEPVDVHIGLRSRERGTLLNSWEEGIGGIIVKGNRFDTVDMAKQAWENGELKKKKDGSNYSRKATGLRQLQRSSTQENEAEPVIKSQQDGKRGGLEYRAPPEHLEPTGKRYTIRYSRGAHTIDYAGWNFVVTVDPISALHLWGLTFKGETIIYETKVEELLAHYTQAHNGWFFLDSAIDGIGLGERLRPLRKGLDCPRHGILLDDSKSLSDGRVCVFEKDLGIPMRTHAGEVGAVGVALVLRAIAIVGNYDYVLDFNFYLTGMVEGTVFLSGELWKEDWAPDEVKYGTRVSNEDVAPLHCHIAVWKVDVDIGGTLNSVEFDEVVADEQIRVGEAFPGHMINRTIIETEKEAAYQFDHVKPIHYMIVNEDQSFLGNKRSVHISTKKSITILQKKSPLYVGAGSWAKYNIATTIRKESELDASIPQDATDVIHAIIDLDEYIDDNESIRRKDLVTWVSCGIWHIPHLEDIPHTVSLGAVLSFTVKPINYFPKDPLFDLHNSWDDGKPNNDPGICGVMREGEDAE
eukprot:GHVL01044923.1.p1 GENE.GHVL01044923.1~~GHVL01044923.1.p1  ORF type:complete len:1503 (-),score=284.84 GHVL01044923.1:2719-7227(-)